MIVNALSYLSCKIQETYLGVVKLLWDQSIILCSELLNTHEDLWFWSCFVCICDDSEFGAGYLPCLVICDLNLGKKQPNYSGLFILHVSLCQNLCLFCSHMNKTLV